MLAQNVGIGTATPGFPLNFASTLGNKISLFGNTGNHYGFGIQSGLLQIYSDASAANIAFGYGSSTSFNERMRIINNGIDGMILNGRLHIKNGSDPVNPSLTGGVWLYKSDNSGQLSFMGTQNNQNVGFFGGPANGGWGFVYDAVNSRVGIGISNPNAPLTFAPSLGKKITLYPGATGDVGFGVAGNRLQIYSDNPFADVAFGYDAAGVFNERFAVKPNGALAVVGNTGNPGQILMSNGAGGAATWTDKPYVMVFNQNFDVHITGVFTESPIPGMDGEQFTIAQNSKVVFTTTLYLATSTFGSPRTETFVEIKNSSNNRVGYADSYFQFHDYPGQRIVANGATVTLTPGTYTIYVKTRRTSTIDGELHAWTAGACACQGGQMILQVLPE